MVQAVILAGGLGTRLREIVADRPKSLADINGKAFLEYQIEYLKKNSIRDIILCIGYLGEKIKNYFLDGNLHGVSIQYCVEQELLGTGGALKKARDLLQKQFFVLNGDTLFLTNLSRMKGFHEQHSAQVTIALTRIADQSRYGSVVLDNQTSRIINFREKSQNYACLISAGIYFMNKNIFVWEDLKDDFSLEHDFFTKLEQTSYAYGFMDTSAYFVDIGTPDGYKKLQDDMKLRRIRIG